MYSVYKHTNKTNGKVYIGMTVNTWEKRWDSGYRNNPHFSRAIKQYGKDGFKHKVVADNLTREEAETLERKLIQEYDSTNPEKGYNIELGGNHNGKHSQETKRKISESQKGRVFTDEHKQRISEALKGRKIGETALEKQRQRMLGNTYTLGMKHTEETKRKMSESHKGKGGRKVICLNNMRVYNSIIEAANENGLNRHSVLNNCLGKTKKIRNSELLFRYYEMEK